MFYIRIITHFYKLGGRGVDHLKVIGVGLNADACINKCCEMGASRCQNLWVFEDTCIAVACEDGKESSCLPRKLTTTRASTVYVQMKHTPEDNELEKVLEWIRNNVPFTTGDTELGDSPPLADAGPKEVTVNLPSSDMYIYLYGNRSKDDKVRPEAQFFLIDVYTWTRCCMVPILFLVCCFEEYKQCLTQT